VITYSSNKQATFGLSSPETKYIATTSVACQVVWLRRVLVDFQEEQKEATGIFCDNNVAISVTKSPTFHCRTKHIDNLYHLIHDYLVANAEIIMKYGNTQEQLANMLTKALPKEKFCYLKSHLGVCDFESKGSAGD